MLRTGQLKKYLVHCEVSCVLHWPVSPFQKPSTAPGSTCPEFVGYTFFGFNAALLRFAVHSPTLGGTAGSTSRTAGWFLTLELFVQAQSKQFWCCSHLRGACRDVCVVSNQGAWWRCWEELLSLKPTLRPVCCPVLLTDCRQCLPLRVLPQRK